MVRSGCVSFFVLALAVAAPARAEEAGEAPPGRIHIFGLRYSLLAGVRLYLSFEHDTRNRFGTRHWSPDVRLWAFDSPKGPHFAWEANWTRLARDERKADYLTTSAGVRFVLAHSAQPVVPYWIIRAGPYFARTDQGSRRTVVGANTELGLSLVRHFVVAARYDLLERVNGFQLSGYTARLDVKVF